MQRRTIFSLLLALAAAAVLALPALAQAPTRLVLVGLPQKATTYVDNGVPGQSAGDQLILQQQLRNLKPQLSEGRGAKVGHLDAICTFTSYTGASGYCSGTFYFGNGSVTGYGKVPLGPRPTANAVIPLIGGTGSYAGARGTLEIQQLKNGNNIYTLDLLP